MKHVQDLFCVVYSTGGVIHCKQQLLHANRMEWQEPFSQLQDMTDALPCRIHLPVCLWIIDPHSKAPKVNTSHGNEVVLQDTRHLIQRPCYQRGFPCQDPAGYRTTQRPPDHCKETQTAVVWSCLPFIRSGQNLARHIERGKKTRQTEEEVERAVEDREGCRKLAVKSSVVPQQPLRLRDRWWDDERWTEWWSCLI